MTEEQRLALLVCELKMQQLQFQVEMLRAQMDLSAALLRASERFYARSLVR